MWKLQSIYLNLYFILYIPVKSENGTVTEDYKLRIIFLLSFKLPMPNQIAI